MLSLPDTDPPSRFHLPCLSLCPDLSVDLSIIWSSAWDYGTYYIGDQRRLRRACASAQSHQSHRCSHTWRYGSRRRVRPNIRHLAPLDGCACAFEEWIYGGQKVPKSHELANLLDSSSSPVVSIRSRVWSQRSRIAGITQDFRFRRCLPRSSRAVSVTALLKWMTMKSKSSIFIYERGTRANLPLMVDRKARIIQLLKFKPDSWLGWFAWFVGMLGMSLSPRHDRF